MRGVGPGATDSLTDFQVRPGCVGQCRRVELDKSLLFQCKGKDLV